MKRMIFGVLAAITIIGATSISTYASDTGTQGTVSTTEGEGVKSEAKVIDGIESLPDDPEYIKILNSREADGSVPSCGSFSQDGFVHNDKFAATTVRQGIDVSYWQGDINWTDVKNSGVEFVFVRVGYRGSDSGTLVADSRGKANITGAINAGLKVGAYMFSQATNEAEAREEADFALAQVAGYNISMPIVMDYEYTATGVGRLYNAHLSKETATATVNAFCSRVQNARYVPMVYANGDMLKYSLNASNIPYKVWLANYTNETSYSGDYQIWQCASNGSVPGINTAVDLDFWYDNGDLMSPQMIGGVYIPSDDAATIRAGAIINTSYTDVTYECTVIDYDYAAYGLSQFPTMKRTQSKTDNWMTYTPLHPGMYGFLWRAYQNGSVISEYGATHYFAGNKITSAKIYVPDRNANTLNFGMVFDANDRNNTRIQWFVYRPDDGVYEAVLSDGLVRNNGEWQQWTKKPGRYWIMCRVTAANNAQSSLCWGVEVRDGVVID